MKRKLSSSIPSLFSKTIINLNLPAALMSLHSHAFAGNVIRLRIPKPSEPLSPQTTFQILRTLLLSQTNEPISPDFKVLPFRKGRPLAGYESGGPRWHLGWLSIPKCKAYLEDSEVGLSGESLVYLGCDTEEDVVYWGVDVPDDAMTELGATKFCFVELRTLMVATDWADSKSMADLAIAGHARALLEWHNTARFCGHCGGMSVSVEAGRRRQCSSELCKRRIYPRLDPVVIMLVIDKENDRVLLSRQSRFVPRMWSCLAGFIEPGESLEEAVRRETWEETGIEVDKVVYHSSQPWPVGPSSMPCQLMIGFFAYAKTLEINVDKEELLDAKWHSRDDVKKALSFAEYKKAQTTAAAKVEQMCKGVEKGQNFSSDFNVESGELAAMFIPGPFAIAHYLITSWVDQQQVLNAATASLSNL